MESRFVTAGPVYLRILVHNRDAFVTYFFIIVKYFSIHKLQLGFVNVSIAPIRFICFTNFNFVYLRRSVRDVV